MSDQPLLWWTSQGDCATIEAIGFHVMKLGYTESEGMPWWPDYLREQYSLRYGRHGRGRLWVDSRFGEIDLSEKMVTLLGKRLGRDDQWSYAGIAIAAPDVGQVAGLPGLVTDLDLRPLRVLLGKALAC
jgi:hypothetical protein